ncbi:hypothetical protein C8R44DRAFT_634856 [Mycena epipterygia]|nr:hypothetical protein C8R44DRAFT_634856 [Mycena epipterygia]
MAAENKSLVPVGYSNFFAGTLNALCGIFWTAAYVLYVRQAREDKSYGMPLLALAANISWEFVYTFVRPVHGVGRFFHFPWVFIDGFLLVKTMKHGPNRWKDSSPLIADNFISLVLITLFMALSAQWSFARQFYESNSCFWSAYFCQNVCPSIYLFIGSLAANIRYMYRVRFWPSKYAFVGGAFATWVLWAPCVADILYPIAYFLIIGRESGRAFSLDPNNSTIQ